MLIRWNGDRMVIEWGLIARRFQIQSRYEFRAYRGGQNRDWNFSFLKLEIAPLLSIVLRLLDFFLSLFFSLLSSSSFFSFCEEKVQVYQLQSYFFFNWFSKQWKIRGCWNWMDLSSLFYFNIFFCFIGQVE